MKELDTETGWVENEESLKQGPGSELQHVPWRGCATQPDFRLTEVDKAYKMISLIFESSTSI